VIDDKVRYGRYHYLDKSTYEGWWKMGQRFLLLSRLSLIFSFPGHGVGKMDMFGQTYIVEWKHNLKNGKGRFQYLTGAIYEGDWVNDAKRDFFFLLFYFSSCWVFRWEGKV